MLPLRAERQSGPHTASRYVYSATLRGRTDSRNAGAGCGLWLAITRSVREADGARECPVAAFVTDSLVRRLHVPLSRHAEGRAQGDRNRDAAGAVKRQAAQKHVRASDRYSDKWLERASLRDLPQRTAGEGRAPASCRLVRPARDPPRHRGAPGDASRQPDPVRQAEVGGEKHSFGTRPDAEAERRTEPRVLGAHHLTRNPELQRRKMQCRVVRQREIPADRGTSPSRRIEVVPGIAAEDPHVERVHAGRQREWTIDDRSPVVVQRGTRRACVNGCGAQDNGDAANATVRGHGTSEAADRWWLPSASVTQQTTSKIARSPASRKTNGQSRPASPEPSEESTPDRGE